MPKIVSDLRVQINIRNIAIITVKTVAYHCIMFNISKSDTADLLENSVLEDRRYIYKNIVLIFSLFKTVFFFTFLFSIYKIVDITKSVSL